MSSDPLSALLNIINSSTKELQSLHAQNGSQFPSLDGSFKPGPSDDDPRAIELSKLVVAAANQLIATVRPPKDTLWEVVTAMYLPAAVGFAVDVDIPEILREAPNQVLIFEIDCHFQLSLIACLSHFMSTTSHLQLNAKPLM